jgi:hypothetical protein
MFDFFYYACRTAIALMKQLLFYCSFIFLMLGYALADTTTTNAIAQLEDD